MDRSAITLFIEAVGCWAPGLEGWAAARAVLRGETPYVHRAIAVPAPERLPANERRRATMSTRLAFRVAEDALAATDLAPDSLASVFASSDGDTPIVDRLCRTLCEAQPSVSPTDFHNSVHNAAAGYWSIATGAQGPSVSLSSGDSTFVSGLLEAAGMALAEERACLLVAFDLCPPPPLRGPCRIAETASVSMLLTAGRRPHSLASLRITVGTSGQEMPMQDAALEALRQATPAARALPLLAFLARETAGVAWLQEPGGRTVALEIEAL